MRHSVVYFAVLPTFFLFSIFALAQHGGGGGGGASGGGGGSHGGGFSGGGSSVSSGGGGHSFGGSGGSHSSGSASHGSASHGSGSRSWNGSGAHSSASSASRPGVKSKIAQLQKTDILTMLRHPFRKQEPKEVVEFRHRICPNGHCPVICARGSASQGFGCATVTLHNSCTHRGVWSGGSCLYQTHFLDDCDRFLADMTRQQRIAAEAERVRQNACAGGVSQQCYMASADAQNQAAIYQTYLDRYHQCRNRTLNTMPFGQYSYLGFSNAFMFEALSEGLR